MIENRKELERIQRGGKDAFLQQTGMGGLLKAWRSARLKEGKWRVPCAFLDGENVIIREIEISDESPMAQKLITEGVFQGH